MKNRYNELTEDEQELIDSFINRVASHTHTGAIRNELMSRVEYKLTHQELCIQWKRERQEADKITFEYQSATTDLVRVNDTHIGWVNGYIMAEKSPLNDKRSTVVFHPVVNRFTGEEYSSSHQFTADEIVDEYERFYKPPFGQYKQA